ncbi:MAG TPA: GGDEF domain-containing protein [Candidatus Saccharimonadia bacterium]|nr:GGDEF domain-containing protein [Candidatus Saccharimonadia bacterium]
MSLSLAAYLLIGGALALALAFHRNRAAQVLATALAAALALAGGDPRHAYGALRFAPWLILAACLVPEPRLVSRRTGLFVLAFVFLALVTVSAPEHVFQGLARAAAFLAFDLPGPRAAAAITLAAAALCLLRWALTARPMELGLALALVPLAYAYSRVDTAERDAALALTGMVGIVAVVYASYRMAFIDALTGLPNRRALDETLMRLSGQYALAMVDVDHFKQFNDTYGHDAGDVVLRQVARTLRRRARASAFRYGGEEFCLIYEGARAAHVREGCEHARAAIESQPIAIPPSPQRPKKAGPKRAHAGEVSVTISVGCAMRGTERHNPSEVLKAADQALYRAKAKGRNRVVAA